MDKLEEIVDELVALSKQEDLAGHEAVSRAYDYAAMTIDDMSMDVVKEIGSRFEDRIRATEKAKMKQAIERDINEARKDQEIAQWKITAAKFEREVASLRISKNCRRLEDHTNGVGW